MKKYVQNIWVRLLACFMCAVSVVGIIASIAGMWFFAQNPDGNEVWESQLETIMEDYALYAVDNIDEVDLAAFFENKNLYIEIDKYSYEQDQDEHKITSIYSNMPEEMESSYQLEIFEHNIPSYSVDSIEGALKSIHEPTTHPTVTVSTSIASYVLDVNDGIFYFNTPDGYFEVDYIEVAEDSSVYAYMLTTINGEKCYFDGYNIRLLDTTKYQEWDWITLCGVHMGITDLVSGSMVQLVQNSDSIKSNLRTEEYFVRGQELNYVSDKLDRFVVNMSLDESLSEKDLFLDWWNLNSTIYSYQSQVVGLLWAFILLLVFSLILLGFSASGDGEKLKIYHKIPVGITTLLLIAVEAVLVGGIAVWNNYFGIDAHWNLPIETFVGTIAGIVFFMAFIAFTYLVNIITRIKSKVFFRYSELYYISRPLVYFAQMVKEQMPLFWKTVLSMLVILLVEFIIIVLFHWDVIILLGFFVVLKLVEIPLIIYVLIQMKQLQQGGQRIAAGDLSQPIDTSKMFWEFKKHGDNINKAGDGIALAVEEQIKSERFKTELITNVSHDIKTPLTSIINYVDLIKKEEITDETLCEYIDVLDRQSSRLKKLIEDLMEASKASTGNLEVNLEECDVEVLLTQVIGEFEEKLIANQLEVVVSKPEEPVLIMADGRHVWRVFDNLMNNICKYSQDNTRVYVSLARDERNVCIVFKNISKAALNIPSDQLMQRFVRGDSSRHTEGSGLGLSIAQSLTELMNGTLKLDIDGDLFKVTLKFNTI